MGANPYTDAGQPPQHGGLFHYLVPLGLGELPGFELEGPRVNPYDGTASQQNAAGSAENLALHVAMIVAFALVGVYVFRASGFKFVVAGSVGVGS